MTSAWELAELLKAPLDVVGSEAEAIVSFKCVGPSFSPDISRATSASTVHLQPWEESEESLDRGDMLAGERAINVLLQSPLENVNEGKCSKWLARVKDAFRELELEAPDGGWRWARNETVVLYDSDAAKEKLQYISVFRAYFRNFA